MYLFSKKNTFTDKCAVPGSNGYFFSLSHDPLECVTSNAIDFPFLLLLLLADVVTVSVLWRLVRVYMLFFLSLSLSLLPCSRPWTFHNVQLYDFILFYFLEHEMDFKEDKHNAPTWWRTSANRRNRSTHESWRTLNIAQLTAHLSLERSAKDGNQWVITMLSSGDCELSMIQLRA